MGRIMLGDIGWLRDLCKIYPLKSPVTARIPVKREVESCVGNTGYMYHCPLCNTLVGMHSNENDSIWILDAKKCSGCGCELNWDDLE